MATAFLAEIKSNVIATAIYEELSRFFGEFLDVEQNDIPDSKWTLDIDQTATPPEFRRATVRVAKTSGDVVASLVHEMLHLRLLARGYPIDHGVQMLDKRRLEAGAVQLYGTISNLIHQEIILADFLAAVGRRDQSVRFDTQPVEVCSMIQDAIKNGEDPWLFRPFYYASYLSVWITSRHLERQDIARMAESIIASGTDYYPSLIKDAQWIRDWIESGKYKDPLRYADTYAELITTLGLPQVSWMRLRRGAAKRVHVDQL
jgi:hypothetical protein